MLLTLDARTLTERFLADTEGLEGTAAFNAARSAVAALAGGGAWSVALWTIAGLLLVTDPGEADRRARGEPDATDTLLALVEARPRLAAYLADLLGHFGADPERN